MADTVLFDNGTHRNILLEDSGSAGNAVQANQHLIIHNDEAMLLDPGGHKVYSQVLTKTFSALGRCRLRYLFLSHQDPDIVAAINGWLMTTDATGYVSTLWQRFVPHFGLDHLMEHRLLGIPDEGMTFEMAGTQLFALPAHFLHSVGNFQIYDPVSKILYTGDLGAALGMEYFEVTDFDAHLAYMEGFHRRYMTTRRAMSAWAAMARQLDIDMIAPQHGAMFRGKAMVKRFIDWADNLECGIDVMMHLYKVPAAARSAAPAGEQPAAPPAAVAPAPVAAPPAAPVETLTAALAAVLPAAPVAPPTPPPPAAARPAAPSLARPIVPPDTWPAAAPDAQPTPPEDTPPSAPSRWSRRQD